MKKVHYLILAIASISVALVIFFLHAQNRLIVHYSENGLGQSIEVFVGWFLGAVFVVVSPVFVSLFYKANSDKDHWICYFS